MTLKCLPLPGTVHTRFDKDAPATLDAIGNDELISAPLLGLLCSREYPGKAIIETLDNVPLWVQSARIIISGFHAPLEQQVLISLLRRHGRAVKVLARTLDGYRLSPPERKAVDARRLLLVSSFPAAIRRTTRETALTRNRLVLALATEIVIPFVADGSPLRHLLAEINP